MESKMEADVYFLGGTEAVEAAFLLSVLIVQSHCLALCRPNDSYSSCQAFFPFFLLNLQV